MVFAYLMVLLQFVSVQSLLEETVQEIRQVDTVTLSLFQIQRDLEMEVLSREEGSPPDRSKVEELSAKLDQAASDYLRRIEDPPKKEILERFLKTRNRMIPLERRMISEATDPSDDLQAQLLSQWKVEAVRAHQALVEVGGIRLRIQGAFLEKIDEKRNITLKIAVFFVVVGGICLVAIWTYTRRNLLIPLRRLAASAEALSKGEEVIRIPDTERKDEVGILARSFETMVAAVQNRTERLLLKNLQLENEVKDRKRAEMELSEAKEDLERRVQERTSEILSRNRDLETLLYVTSHDLREPLRAIRHFSMLLSEAKDPPSEEEKTDYLLRIQKGAARLDQLIEL